MRFLFQVKICWLISSGCSQLSVVQKQWYSLFRHFLNTCCAHIVVRNWLSSNKFFMCLPKCYPVWRIFIKVIFKHVLHFLWWLVISICNANFLHSPILIHMHIIRKCLKQKYKVANNTLNVNITWQARHWMLVTSAGCMCTLHQFSRVSQYCHTYVCILKSNAS